jgi:methylase of polypeptide subunit release factors
MGPLREEPLNLDRDAVRRVRDVFLSAGYTQPAVEQLLGAPAGDYVRCDQRKWPCFWRRAAGASPLTTLARVFLFGTVVDETAFRSAVAPSTTDDWVRLGLVAAEATAVRARWRIVPMGPHLYVNDAPWVVHHDERTLMMAPSPSSEKLAQLTIRRPCDSAVDVGTGSGYQAFHAAAHCKHVVATDYSPRALGIAQFNAALNGLDVECLVGDCFEPVAGRKFDLVVSNPPYVVSPGGEQVYRDSGKPGDQFSERIVREAPSHLNPGGFAHILINWVQRTGEDWRARLHSWVRGSGCDMYLLFAPPEDVDVYATAWSPEADGASENFRKTFDQWMAFFERERVEKIYGGAVVLRKREGKNWFLCADAPGLIGAAGDAILGEFERFDYLNRTPDAQLLADRFRLSPNLGLTQTLAPEGGKLKAVAFNLKLRHGLTHGGPVGGDIFAVVARIRPEDALIAGALPALRDLIFHGMLLPEPRA